MKRSVISDLLLLSFWVVMCCLDSIVQWDLRGVTLGGWYALIRKGCLLGAFVWSWHFIGGKWIRFAYIPLAIWMCLVLLMEWFVRMNFNMEVTGDLWLFIEGSSKDEVKSFAFQFLTIKTTCLIVLAASAIWGAVRFLRRMQYWTCTWTRAVAFVMTLAFVSVLGNVRPFRLSSWDRFLDGSICKVLVPDLLSNKSKWQELARARARPCLPEGLVSSIRPGCEPLGVVVIGESATRNHMHLYGYPRDTTPWADSVRNELVCLTNLVASAPHTQLALRELFTDATLDAGGVSWLLPQALKRFGYASGVVSGQGHWGRGAADSCLATIFSILDRSVYLDDETTAWPKYDRMLLPYVKQYLGLFCTNCPSALFVHLNGSHYDFKYRCPPDEARWPVDLQDELTQNLSPEQRRRINQYDSSIAYTDGILSNVVCEVRKANRPAFVLYFSDHGETPASSAFRDQADRDLWEIPFFVWFSPEYAMAYPETVRRLRAVEGAPLQLDQMTLGILELFQIAGSEGSGSFLQSGFQFRRQRMILRGKKAYDPLMK